MVSLNTFLSLNHAIDNLKEISQTPGDSTIFPFRTSQDLQQAYLDLESDFESYISDSNNREEVKRYAQNIRVVYKLESIDDTKLLQIIFRIRHFYYLQPFKFDATEDIILLISYLESAVHDELSQIKKSSQLAIVGYLKFAIFVCINVPQFEYTGKSSINERINSSNNFLGSLFPISSPKIDFEVVLMNFKRKRSDFMTYKANLLMPPIFKKIYNEAHLQYAISDFYMVNIAKILSTVITSADIIPNPSRTTVFPSGVKVHTLPDIIIDIAGNVVPIEVKHSDLNDAFVCFQQRGTSFDRKSFEFCNVFTQSVREAMSFKSGIALITDFNNIIYVDLRGAALEKTLYEPEAGNVLRGLNCFVHAFNPIHDGMGTAGLLLCLIEDYALNYNETVKEEMMDLYTSMVFEKSEEKKLIFTKYQLMNTIFLDFEGALNSIRAEKENVTNKSYRAKEILLSQSPSPEDAYLLKIAKINGKRKLILPASDLQGWSILQQYKNWRSYSVSELLKKYKLLTVVSGSTCHSSFGIVLKVRDRTIFRREMAVKIFDPYRAFSGRKSNTDFGKAMATQFDLFSREVVALSETKTNFTPKLYEYGTLSFPRDKAKQVGDPISMKKVAAAGYFIITEWLEGPLLSEVDDRSSIKPKVELAVNSLHEEGLYHGDIHSRNIIITKKNQDVKIFDFGSSALSTLRCDIPKIYSDALKWHEGRLKGTSEEDRKQRDLRDLRLCFE